MGRRSEKMSKSAQADAEARPDMKGQDSFVFRVFDSHNNKKIKL